MELVIIKERRTKTGERKPENGERRPEEGGRRKEEGGRRKENENRRPEDGDRRPEEGERQNFSFLTLISLYNMADIFFVFSIKSNPFNLSIV